MASGNDDTRQHLEAAPGGISRALSVPSERSHIEKLHTVSAHLYGFLEKAQWRGRRLPGAGWPFWADRNILYLDCTGGYTLCVSKCREHPRTVNCQLDLRYTWLLKKDLKKSLLYIKGTKRCNKKPRVLAIFTICQKAQHLNSIRIIQVFTGDHKKYVKHGNEQL